MKTATAMGRTALLIGATLLSTSALAVSLQDGALKRTETIQYKLPEANTEAGATALYQQLRAAAERVCREDAVPAVWSSYTREAEAACAETALDKAVARIGIASVSLLHMQSRPGARLAVFAGQ
jgi:UrcA family protein